MELDELKHYGVKGMKWGIRRTPAQLGHRPSTKKKKDETEDGSVKTAAKKVGRAISDKRAASKQKKAAKQKADEAKKELQRRKNKPLSEMTDDELRRVVNRLQLEQQYHQYNPRQVSLGEKFVKSVGMDIIKPAATNAGRQLLQDQLLKQGKKLASK